MEENQNGQEYIYNTEYNYTPVQSYNQENEVMSVGQWLLTILATIVPCVGLVIYLYWAFSGGGNQNRKNYCKAWLIYWVITTILSVILGVLGILVFSQIPAFGQYY